MKNASVNCAVANKGYRNNFLGFLRCIAEDRSKFGLMVPGAGLEPARGFPRGILSPLRLPVSPPGR